MKSTTKMVLWTASALALSVGAHAGELTFNLGATSDYKFRGQSQSQTNPAVFGGVDYVSEHGFFAGAWASSIDFDDTADTYLEVDLYAGFTHAFTDETSGTVKMLYYVYPTADYAPGDDEYDYLELVASVSQQIGVITAGLELAYSPDFFLETGTAYALTGSASLPLTENWWVFDGGLTASAKLGYQWIDDNVGFGTPDYLYYDIGVTGKIGKVGLDLRYVDTDLSAAECFLGTNLCESKIVGTFTLYLP